LTLSPRLLAAVVRVAAIGRLHGFFECQLKLVA
jgi:hypothetical protein